MFTRRNLLSLAMSAVAVTVITGSVGEANAQDGNRIRLQASMRAGITKAVAKYEQRSNRRKFTFELQKGTPGTVISVRVNGQEIGARQIDALGLAKIDIDTTEGNAVPSMTAGQVVSVWVGKNMVMSGELRPSR